MKLFFFLFSALLCTPTSFAAKFSNPFLEFDTPPQWQCSQEQGEWLCQVMDGNRKKDALVVLAAKIKGPKDTMEDYQRFLDSPKTFAYQGRSVKSEKKYTKTDNINGHVWVDSLHLESELPGFFTRYLATIKQDIGVLVTFSVNKDKYQDTIADFDFMIKSIKVFRKTAQEQAPATQFGNTIIPTNVTNETVFGNVAPRGGADQPKVGKKPVDSTDLLLLGGAIIAILFWLWKKRKSS